MNDLILYTTEDGKNRIQLRTDLRTMWLNQLEVAELFQIGKQNIIKHLKAIFAEQGSSPDSVVNHRLKTAATDKQQDALHADQQADADQKALENTVKHRPKK